MTEFSNTTTDSPAKIVAQQIEERRRLIAENRILWDLLLFDMPDIETYEADIRSKKVSWLLEAWRSAQEVSSAASNSVAELWGRDQVIHGCPVYPATIRGDGEIRVCSRLGLSLGITWGFDALIVPDAFLYKGFLAICR
jgi:hypothetical protein